MRRRVTAYFLGDSGFNRTVWIGLYEVDMGYVNDSVKVITAVIIIAQSDMKYLMKVNLE